MEGTGELIYDDAGGRYEGGFRGGLREGKGTCTFPEGEQQVSGRWVKDQLPLPGGAAAAAGETEGGGGGSLSSPGGSPSSPLSNSGGANPASSHIDLLLPKPFYIPSLEMHVLPITLGNQIGDVHLRAGWGEDGETLEDT